MKELYIDKVAAERARRALQARQPITIAGMDADGKMAVLSGLVHSVETGLSEHSGYGWRVTIFEQEAKF
jgi:hypothetical protein